MKKVPRICQTFQTSPLGRQSSTPCVLKESDRSCFFTRASVNDALLGTHTELHRRPHRLGARVPSEYFSMRLKVSGISTVPRRILTLRFGRELLTAVRRLPCRVLRFSCIWHGRRGPPRLLLPKRGNAPFFSPRMSDFIWLR